MPKAYCIVTISAIHDQQTFARYVQGHATTLATYGGRFLVKGAMGEILEGDWPGTRTVLHEFPSREAFYAWYDSADYRPWRNCRQSCAEVNVMVVDGVAEVME